MQRPQNTMHRNEQRVGKRVSHAFTKHRVTETGNYTHSRRIRSRNFTHLRQVFGVVDSLLNASSGSRDEGTTEPLYSSSSLISFEEKKNPTSKTSLTFILKMTAKTRRRTVPADES